MKRVCSVIAGFFLFVLSINAHAQAQPAKDYFPGKWDVTMEGLPQGDPRMMVNLERKNSTLEGAIMDSTQKEIAKITKVEETEKSVVVYFTAGGYDVTLELIKKDDDHITASLMGMFDGKGVRIKETK